MSKRRRKRRQRNRDAAGKPGGDDGTTSPSAATKSATSTIVPWRERIRGLIDGLRAYARDHHGAALEQLLKKAFGNPPAIEHPADAERLVDDFVTTPGSGGGGRSILRAFCEDAPGIDAEDREQALRWEQERRRGVFLVQRCFPDHIELWDPLEGAGLTLALLDRMPAGRAAEIRRGTVATTTFLPYGARLVAVGLLELYADHEAMKMFREQVVDSGRPWHDAPPPAPKPSN